MQTIRASTWLIILLAFTFLSSKASTPVTGIVTDSLTAEPLVGAVVRQINTNNVCVTNKFGFFNIPVEGENIKLCFSFIGYQTKQKELRVKNKNFLNIILSPGVSINEVTISATKVSNTQINETGVVHLPVKQINSIPALFGEPDLMRALKTMPGISGGDEGKSDIHVRGGSPDQNLILLDDIPIYYIGHYGGFLSTFNTSVISDVKLYKGGFPARYGGRLSSVMDIRLKNGDLYQHHGEGMLGLLSSKVFLEGPLVKGKSSYIVSFRKNTFSVFELFFDDDIKYSFYDFNLKLNYKLNEKNRIYVSAFANRDKLSIGDKLDFSFVEEKNLSETKWGNKAASVRLNTIFNQQVFVNTSLSYTSYFYSGIRSSETVLDSADNQIVENSFSASIDDVILKIEPEFYIGRNYKIRTGASSTLHVFNPGKTEYFQEGGTLSYISNSYSNSIINSLEFSAYLENHVKLLNSININAGLYFSSYNILNGTSYSSTEPRITVNYQFLGNASVKASYTKMKQYLHFLTYSGIGIPSDYWMPSTNGVPPLDAQQYSLGFAVDMFSNKIEITLDAYYKQMSNLISFQPGASMFAANVSWEEKIEMNGSGNSKGIELLIEKTQGKTTGWASFTLAKSDRVFENKNNGKSYPYKYDRTIDFSINIIQELSSNINLSASWQYGSGYPITIPLERYESGNDDIWLYSDINSFRMQDYHRLDVGFNHTKKRKRLVRIINFSIYNVYNRKNPYYYYCEREREFIMEEVGSGYGYYEVWGAYKIHKQSLIPFLPTVSLTYKF